MFSRRSIKLIPTLLLIFLFGCSSTTAPSVAPSETSVITDTTVTTETTVETTVTETTLPTETTETTEPEIVITDEDIYSLFVVTPEQLIGDDKLDYVTEVTPELQTALDSKPVTGVVIFSGNIEDPDQIKALNSEFNSRGMLVCIDEEGGDIVRIAADEDFDVPLFSNAAEEIDPYTRYTEIATYLQDYGFNTDFAPVADIAFDETSVIGDRAFGSDSSTVSTQVMSSCKAFNDAGMIYSLKHFPGHGGTTADSHFDTAVLYRTREELDTEFEPFVAGISCGAPMIMIGHIDVPEITGDLPSSLSSEMIMILRYDLGYEGVIITDSFWMEAITERYGSGESAVMALKAGADIVLMPDDLDEAFIAVRTAIDNGELSKEEVVSKLERIKALKESHNI